MNASFPTRISVVVPVYNSARYVEACIQGLHAQTYPRDHYEILMVDNNSTDRSREIVHRHPDVVLLAEAVQSSYAARNRALREATGSVIAFTDADCVPDPSWLQSIAEAMRPSQVRVVLGARHFARESTVLALLAEYEETKAAWVFASKLGGLYFGYTNNMAVRRDVFDELGPFAPRSRGGDTIFVRKVVDRLGVEAVTYREDVRVRHLEIDGILAYLRKVFVYGRSRRQYRHLARVRALRLDERVRIFRQVVGRRNRPLGSAVRLLPALFAGQMCWLAGSISTRRERFAEADP